MWVPRGSSPDEKWRGRRKISSPFAPLTFPLACLAFSFAAKLTCLLLLLFYFIAIRTSFSRQALD